LHTDVSKIVDTDTDCYSECKKAKPTASSGDAKSTLPNPPDEQT